MARIKHIALSTDDPVKTAEFYKDVFGLGRADQGPHAAVSAHPGLRVIAPGR